MKKGFLRGISLTLTLALSMSLVIGTAVLAEGETDESVEAMFDMDAVAVEEENNAAAEELPEEAVKEDPFVDIDGHWAAEAISALAEVGVVSGVGDRQFAPNRIITVAELSSMLCKAFGVEIQQNTEQVYPAVNKGAWYYDVINSMARIGYLRKDAEIQPEAAASLNFAVTTLYRMADNPQVTNTAVYNNQYVWFDGLTGYEKDAFTYAIDTQILNKLYESSDADNLRSLTRAEAAALVYKAQFRLGI